MDQLITGIVVCHNTKDLMARAYNSIRNFHPNMKMIIVDGSDTNDECYTYVSSLIDHKIRVFHASTNIGHGKGLHHALQQIDTPFAMIFDSDIEMVKSPIKEMMEMMKPDTYGIGVIAKTDFRGFDTKSEQSIDYLHPFFNLIQVKEYKKYKPFIHHGAPAINTCIDIYRKGLSKKVFIDFPNLTDYVHHAFYGTRGMRVSKSLQEIEGAWEPVIDEGGITAITCTGDRPFTFSLCQRWIEQQTVKPDQWIIIDDGRKMGARPNLPYADYVYRTPRPGEPKHTLILNMNEALKRITGNKIIIMEDDEYYAPAYIETMSQKLNDYEIVGIGRSRYYYLPTFKHYLHPNMGHASLAQTAFKKSFLPFVTRQCAGTPFLDIRLWGEVNGAIAGTLKIDNALLQYESKDKRGFIFDDRENPIYVGMKGMPGRLGIGSGHGNADWYSVDVNKDVLRRWIRKDEDFNTYLTCL